jgi:hypothetical protein
VLQDWRGRPRSVASRPPQLPPDSHPITPGRGSTATLSADAAWTWARSSRPDQVGVLGICDSRRQDNVISWLPGALHHLAGRQPAVRLARPSRAANAVTIALLLAYVALFGGGLPFGLVCVPPSTLRVTPGESDHNADLASDPPVIHMRRLPRPYPGTGPAESGQAGSTGPQCLDLVRYVAGT